MDALLPWQQLLRGASWRLLWICPAERIGRRIDGQARGNGKSHCARSWSRLDSMATKFDRPDAWQALEAEDRAYWAQRTIEDRSASVIALSSELLAVQRQGDPSHVEAADRIRRAEKLRGWIALKERVRWPSAIRQSSKTSSAER